MKRIAALMGLGVLALSGCRNQARPIPIDSLNDQQNRGREVFHVWCATCHHDRRNDALHGPSLMGVFQNPSLPSGTPANDERVRSTIVNGHNLMPAMGDSMNKQDMDDLIAYLHTL